MKYFLSIVLSLLVFLLFFRFEIILPEEYGVSSALGFSFLRLFSFLAILRISYFFLPYYDSILTSISLKLVYFFIGIWSIYILSQYEIGIILSDKIATFLLMLFLVLFSIKGRMYMSVLFDGLPNAGTSMKSAFVNYPPTKVSDFVVFYIFLLFLFFVPLVVEFMWKN